MSVDTSQLADESVLHPQLRRPLGDDEQLIDYPEIGIQLIASLNRDKGELLGNVKSAIKREGWQKIWPHEPQDTVLVIVAGGPSLETTVDEIRHVKEAGAHVVALANTGTYLLDRGISPAAQVLLDGQPRNASFVVDVPDCTYFVASQCDPGVFDAVEATGSQRRYIWHAINNAEEMDAVMGTDEPWCPVQSGSTIALRALRLFQILGYYRFHVFGMDSCVLNDKHHAYAQPKADKLGTAQIGCNGRDFTVQGWMVNQAMEFMRFTRAFGGPLEMKVHGNGLIAHMIESIRSK